MTPDVMEIGCHLNISLDGVALISYIIVSHGFHYLRVLKLIIFE